MQCKNCSKDNLPEARFCASCGAPLPTPEAEHPPETPADVSLQAVQQEMRRLRETVELMNNRLIALERVPAAPGLEVKPTQPARTTNLYLLVNRPSTENIAINYYSLLSIVMSKFGGTRWPLLSLTIAWCYRVVLLMG